jgi:hypothetical protein
MAHLSAVSQNCMCATHRSTDSLNWDARPRSHWQPWHNFVWGIGNSVQTGIYATEPFYKLLLSNALH